MPPTVPPVIKEPGKKQEDLVGLSRIPVINQLSSIKDSILKRAPTYNMHGLVDENKWKWLFQVFFHLGNNRYTYQNYENLEMNNGIFTMDEECRNRVTIALLGDWASDTEESQQIAGLAAGNDYSIHLGDTYYVGNSREIAENFNTTFGGTWPYGKYGSFAMLGNHEMYSSGKCYFTELIPYMGVYQGKNTRQQEASFFCLENEYWRIIGLDTGYYSLKGWLGLKTNTKLKLHPKQLSWLKETVQLSKDNRGIIFLSHHPPVSAFEPEEYQTMIGELALLVGERKTVLWFWGHEHRMAAYGYNQIGGKLSCFGRCIGNSGMPVELKHKPKSANPLDASNRNLVVYDNRIRETLDEKIKIGHNGYTILTLSGSQLITDYFDESFSDLTGKLGPVLTEEWSIDLLSGTLKGERICDHTLNSAYGEGLTHFQDNLNRAIERQ